MLEKIVELLKENIHLFFDKEKNELVVNVDVAANEIQQWINSENIYEEIRGVLSLEDMSEVYKKKYEIEKSDLLANYKESNDDESISSEEKADRSLSYSFSSGWISGYEQCYETITGKKHDF